MGETGEDTVGIALDRGLGVKRVDDELRLER